MKYLELDTGRSRARRPLPWWIKVLQFIIPAANPDLAPYMDRARIWWIEIDDNGLPLREIGFDPGGLAVVLGPVSGNHGFLLDSSDDTIEALVADEKLESHKAAERFDAEWNSLWTSPVKVEGFSDRLMRSGEQYDQEKWQAAGV
jgi:hypothetical protein